VRWVVVPTLALKQWIQHHLAADPKIGIAAGVRFLFLEEAVREEAGLLQAQLVTEEELALQLESLLRSHLGLSGFESLQAFVAVNPKKRLPALSRQVARHFLEYGVYGARMVEQWAGSGWQEVLWRELAAKGIPHWAELLKARHCLPLCDQLHLFGFSHLPSLFYHFLAEADPVIYVVSPCVAFWTDVRSDRESRALLGRYRKRGVPERQIEELAGYLRSRNRLLANFGKLGREMATLLEDAPATESYFLTGALQGEESYGEGVLEGVHFDATHQLTALKVIQADLLLLRNCADHPPLELTAPDRSIQVHGAPSRWREVEVLAQALRESLATRAGPVYVMTPDIVPYVPFIRAVFDDDLRAQIEAIQPPPPGSVEAAMEQLVLVAESRWEVSRLLALLDHPLVQRVLGWDACDRAQAAQLFHKAGIRWGLDPEQCKESLTRAYGPVELHESLPQTTWKAGLARLVRTVEAAQSPPSDPGDVRLVEGLCQLVERLPPLLQPLVEGEWTLEEWALHWDGLCQEWTGLPCPTANRLREMAARLSGARFSFESIRGIVLERQTGITRGEDLTAVHFCSLTPMRVLPGSIICLMGMEEGAFPRAALKQPLNHLHRHPLADYHPSRSDLDRYLFLEALLAARDLLIVTYCSVAEDGQPQAHSALVSELLAAVEQSVHFGGSSPVIHRLHPQLACHHSYFIPGNCHDPVHFAQAKVAYGLERHRKIEMAIDWSLDQQLELGDLTLALRDPIGLYVNRSLGLRISPPEGKSARDQELFSLDPLLRHRLAWERVQGSLPSAWLLPPAPLRQAVERDLAERANEIHHFLQTVAVQPAELFSLELSPDCQEPARGERGLISPPLVVKNHQIVGWLRALSSRGLIYAGSDDLAGVLVAWPRLLIYSCLAAQFNLPTQILVLQSRKIKEAPSNPTAGLLELLAYLEQCRASPLSFIPSAAELVWQRDFEKAAEKLRRNQFTSWETRWWLENHGKQEDPESLALRRLIGMVKEWL
jgi:exodeoxyribonuclease V gamma subunit